MLLSAPAVHDHMDALDRLERGGHVGTRCRAQRLLIRTDEEEVLAGTLKAALDTFPAFKENYCACEKRRQSQLSEWWRLKDPRLIPLLKACAELGNFDRRMGQPIQPKQEDKDGWGIF